MNTKEILNEWRIFLNENKFTDVKYKEGQKVKTQRTEFFHFGK